MELGAGRRRKEDEIDPSVGLLVLKRIGDKVEKGEPVFEVRYSHKETVRGCLERLEAAVRIEPEPPSTPELFLDRMEM